MVTTDTAQAQDPRILELQTKRESRLQQETIDSLSPEAKKIFEANSDPMNLFRDIVQQTRKERDQQISAEIEQARVKKVQAMRNGIGKFGPGHNEEVRRYAQELQKQYTDDRAKRELEAERLDYETDRVLAALDEPEKAIFLRLWNEANKPEEKLQRAQEARQTAGEQKQIDLYNQYMAEAAPFRGQRTKIYNIRQKYYEMGWDGNARE